MSTFANEKFANAIALKEQLTPPIWFMRQAGRYHSHYQGLRKKHSFEDLCKIPELAAETALGPIQDFDFDVSILFSDLLFPLEALGMGLKYTDKGPQLGFSLNQENLSKLKPWEDAVEGILFQGDAVKATRALLPANKSLIGFVGSPWTLFVYACEGTHKGHLETAKSSLSFYNSYLEAMLPLLEKNIQVQLDAGAELVMLFDTAAGALSPAFFEEYIAPGIAHLASRYSGRVSYYMKEGTEGHLTALKKKGAWEHFAGIGYDHRWSLPQVLSEPGRKHYVQGNFDQSLLLCDEPIFRKGLDTFVKEMKELTPEQRRGWVCGLGHGILPKVPESYVRTFVETIRKEFA